MNQRGSSPEVIRFGVFEADTRTQELRKEGLRIKLQGQPFQVLCLLLSHPGELVTREELRLKLWPADTFVDFEHGLNKAISKLREALNDDPETPRYIETLPRRGYRFIVPIRSEEPQPGPGESPGPAVPPLEPVATDSPRQSGWRTSALILVLVVVALLASFLWYRGHLWPLRPAAAKLTSTPIRSLAVLPLQNLSGDQGQEYFADGMTDELITDLGQLRALRVISRTSVMHYKNTTKTLPQIGRELSADAIVEGTVFRSGNRVRITAQLVDTRTDRHLWAHQYERDLRDVITLQDEVARDIADEIQVKLTPVELARLRGSHPVNPEAHEAYLKARYYWDRFSEPDVKKSAGFYQEVVARDPNSPLGYSGLADYYAVMYVRFGAYSRAEACPKGKAAAREAMALDDSSAEAHLSLAALRLWCDWDWQGAESGFKRAIELNPNYAEAHRVYAVFLSFRGQDAAALHEMGRAMENDPMSVDSNMLLGWVEFMTRHYDQAAKQYRKVLEMNPSWLFAQAGLCDAYAQQKQFDLALRECRETAAHSGNAPWALTELGYVEAIAGKRQEAFEILKQLKEMSRDRPAEALDWATLYAALGEKEHALAWLDKAYERHAPDVLTLKVDPTLDSLRSDPRFQDLVRRVGL